VRRVRRTSGWSARCLKTVKPNELTDDEIVAMVEILRAAADRKQETQPGVVYLDLVRSGQRTRR